MPYTWSINNVVMAETAHTALAYWQAGRADEAFRLFKGALLDSMYHGPLPGQRRHDHGLRHGPRRVATRLRRCSWDRFASVVEGLFGVKPDALAGELVIRPGFPAEWDHARLHHPDLDLAFQRKGHTWSYAIEPRFAQRLRLRLRRGALHQDREHGRQWASSNLACD